jgi:hypothetical protein
MKKLLFLLGLFASTAHAADEYYTIQAGSVASDVGGVTATGFFETNGFGTSHWANRDAGTWDPVIIGFDITLTYEGQSVNLCTSLSYGCAHNPYYTGADDWVFWPPQITATPKGLFCENECFLSNSIGNGTSSGFGFESGSAEYAVGDRVENGVPFGNLLIDTTVKEPTRYNITGGGASTTMPGAPELDAGSAAAALTLLAGVGLVLRGRRRG